MLGFCAGIARILSSPAFGNMAVALLARKPGPLNDLAKSLQSQTPNAIEAFPTDTSPNNLRKTFMNIRAHQSFHNLKLRVAIFSIRTWAKKPFMSETFEEFMAFQETYVGGAMVFAQESLKRFFEDHGEKTLAEGTEKKGALIFTSTLVRGEAKRGEIRKVFEQVANDCDRALCVAMPSSEAMALLEQVYDSSPRRWQGR